MLPRQGLTSLSSISASQGRVGLLVRSFVGRAAASSAAEAKAANAASTERASGSTERLPFIRFQGATAGRNATRLEDGAPVEFARARALDSGAPPTGEARHASSSFAGVAGARPDPSGDRVDLVAALEDILHSKFIPAPLRAAAARPVLCSFTRKDLDALSSRHLKAWLRAWSLWAAVNPIGDPPGVRLLAHSLKNPRLASVPTRTLVELGQSMARAAHAHTAAGCPLPGQRFILSVIKKRLQERLAAAEAGGAAATASQEALAGALAAVKDVLAASGGGGGDTGSSGFSSAGSSGSDGESGSVFGVGDGAALIGDSSPLMAPRLQAYLEASALWYGRGGAFGAQRVHASEGEGGDDAVVSVAAVPSGLAQALPSAGGSTSGSDDGSAWSDGGEGGWHRSSSSSASAAGPRTTTTAVPSSEAPREQLRGPLRKLIARGLSYLLADAMAAGGAVPSAVAARQDAIDDAEGAAAASSSSSPFEFSFETVGGEDSAASGPSATVPSLLPPMFDGPTGAVLQLPGLENGDAAAASLSTELAEAVNAPNPASIGQSLQRRLLLDEIDLPPPSFADLEAQVLQVLQGGAGATGTAAPLTSAPTSGTSSSKIKTSARRSDWEADLTGEGGVGAEDVSWPVFKPLTARGKAATKAAPAAPAAAPASHAPEEAPVARVAGGQVLWPPNTHLAAAAQATAAASCEGSDAASASPAAPLRTSGLVRPLRAAVSFAAWGSSGASPLQLLEPSHPKTARGLELVLRSALFSLDAAAGLVAALQGKAAARVLSPALRSALVDKVVALVEEQLEAPADSGGGLPGVPALLQQATVLTSLLRSLASAPGASPASSSDSSMAVSPPLLASLLAKTEAAAVSLQAGHRAAREARGDAAEATTRAITAAVPALLADVTTALYRLPVAAPVPNARVQVRKACYALLDCIPGRAVSGCTQEQLVAILALLAHRGCPAGTRTRLGKYTLEALVGCSEASAAKAGAAVDPAVAALLIESFAVFEAVAGPSSTVPEAARPSPATIARAQTALVRYIKAAPQSAWDAASLGTLTALVGSFGASRSGGASAPSFVGSLWGGDDKPTNAASTPASKQRGGQDDGASSSSSSEDALGPQRGRGELCAAATAPATAAAPLCSIVLLQLAQRLGTASGAATGAPAADNTSALTGSLDGGRSRYAALVPSSAGSASAPPDLPWLGMKIIEAGPALVALPPLGPSVLGATADALCETLLHADPGSRPSRDVLGHATQPQRAAGLLAAVGAAVEASSGLGGSAASACAFPLRKLVTCLARHAMDTKAWSPEAGAGGAKKGPPSVTAALGAIRDLRTIATAGASGSAGDADWEESIQLTLREAGQQWVGLLRGAVRGGDGPAAAAGVGAALKSKAAAGAGRQLA